MGKKLLVLVCLVGSFYLGMEWDDISKQSSDSNDTVTTNDVTYLEERNYMLYKLNEKIFEKDEWKKVSEGTYKVYVKPSNGEPSELFDGSREIVKDGDDYFLKVKSIYSENPEFAQNEYFILSVIEKQNLKLMLSKTTI